jgi:glycerate kinase
MIKNVLVIPDKFKFTFSSDEIGKIISNIIKKYYDLNVIQLPVSDGGEGFLDVIERVLNTEKIYHKSFNPIFQPLNTFFLKKNEDVFIEYAKTGGLNLLDKTNRNPLYTSSFGLGLQIKQAFKYRPKNIYIGIGGSSTNDAGMGMAAALGVRFLDKHNNQLMPIGLNLQKIHKIVFPVDFDKYKNAKIICLADVENKMYGKKGAAYIYAKQKGASDYDIKLLDKGLRNFAKIVKKNFDIDLQNINSAGAAGALGAGLHFFLDAHISSGFSFIFNMLKLERIIKKSELIITGEGKLDKQSFQGKFVGQVVKLSRKYNKKILVVAGCSEISKSKDYEIIELFDCNTKLQIAKNKTVERLENLLKNIDLNKL